MDDKDIDIRKALLDFVNNIDDDEEVGPDINITACAIDVTGSLGVWGIS